MSEGSTRRPPSFALRDADLRPRKSLGQNFLQNRAFVERVASAIEPGPEDTVVEIGPGTGVVTDILASLVKCLIAIELDEHLAQLLTDRYADTPHVAIRHGDALEFDPCVEIQGDYKVVGNIPYYATGQIIRYFLEVRCPASVIVFMVQREVAERMVAQPGNLSLLGVSVQYYAVSEIVARVPAGAFYPRPRVDSAIVRLRPRADRPDAAQTAALFTVARAGFGNRRKQLGNSVALGLGIKREQADALLHSAGIAPDRRAETLSIAEWKAVARAYVSQVAGKQSDAVLAP